MAPIARRTLRSGRRNGVQLLLYEITHVAFSARGGKLHARREDLARLGDFRQAEAYCRKALAVDPDCQRASLQLAELSEPSTPHE